jgi:hypothetical protein
VHRREVAGGDDDVELAGAVRQPLGLVQVAMDVAEREEAHSRIVTSR